MASAVLARWHEADHGIWEARRAPRHHVYTKVMCWVTLDRALRTAVRHGAQGAGTLLGGHGHDHPRGSPPRGLG